MRVKNNCTKLQLEFILISLSYGEVFPSRLFSSFCGSVTKAFSLMLYFSKLDFLLERCCIKIKIIFWAAECNSQHGILKSNNEVEDVTKNPFLGKNLKTWWYMRVYIIFVWPRKALNVKFCNWFFFREAAKSLANTFSSFVMAL